MGFFGGGASVDLASPSAIGSTTPNTGAFTTLSANNGTITTSSPAFTLAQTWNAAGTTFTALQVNITDTASASGSLLLNLRVGSNSAFRIFKSGVLYLGNPSFNGVIIPCDGGIGINKQNVSTTNVAVFLGAYASVNSIVTVLNSGRIGFSSAATDCQGGNALADVYFTRDAANTMALKNDTNAQTFRLYNTFTDASNYERVDLRWTSNVFEINTRNGAAGTGTARNVHITIPNNGAFQINGGSGGGELLGVRTDYIGFPAIGIEMWTTGWGGSAVKCLNFFSNKGITWSNSTSNRNTIDCGIVRNSAGVLEVNDGNTAGTFRDLIVRNFRMSAPTGVPTANNSTGTEGSISWDADYIYICTATNTWKRVAIATWP